MTDRKLSAVQKRALQGMARADAWPIATHASTKTSLARRGYARWVSPDGWRGHYELTDEGRRVGLEIVADTQEEES